MPEAVKWNRAGFLDYNPRSAHVETKDTAWVSLESVPPEQHWAGLHLASRRLSRDGAPMSYIERHLISCPQGVSGVCAECGTRGPLRMLPGVPCGWAHHVMVCSSCADAHERTEEDEEVSDE